MKVVELRAERDKICKEYLSCHEPYIARKNAGLFGGCANENVSEKTLRENYETDQKMLVRLDKINNALNESDANTYIDVHGKHLSIATARKYLAELRPITKNEEEDSIWEDCPCYQEYSGNKQATVYNKCVVNLDDEGGIVTKDPMHLMEKQKELKAKRDSWKYDLLTKVLISDATTEVSFVE